jgi:PadR family transcriptional regulator, regulatory protein AphA
VVQTPSATLNQTARIVLGMIAEGHTTGYAIKAEIERSTRLYWGASIGGIYPELRRLTDTGLISVRDDPRGESVRHCYEITHTGRAALRAWLTDVCAPAVELRDEALLQLRFAGVLDADERLEVIRRKHALHELRVRELEGLLDAGEFDDPFHKLTVEFGVGWNRWARDWCEQTERELERAVQKRAS